MLKTHNCGELRRADVGRKVTLAGWVNRRRDHGGLVFIDLRDREGVVQVVFNPEVSGDCHQVAEQLRSEYVLRVTGEVASRPAGTENSALPTGYIEIIAGEAEILNTSLTPPFAINEELEVDENLRLKYRYLDLRRPWQRDNLILRHRIVKFIRDFLDADGFIEVETPVLTKSTPEGARDYLVPSRVHAGKFYALPQSPQQMKQLLMVAGFEKYYQIAKCFRDEDTRADRQPEFTQLDLEMSFIGEEDIIDLMEHLFVALAETIKPEMNLVKPFPRLSYTEAMSRYGSDKPDLRFGLEIKDLSDIVKDSEFGIFRAAVSDGGSVRGIRAPGCAGYSRGQTDELIRLAKDAGAAGLVTIALDATTGSLADLTMEQVKSAAAKFLSVDEVRQMAARLEAVPGDMLLLVAGDSMKTNEWLGALRLEMGHRLGLADDNTLAFAFVRHFPLFRWDEKGNRWDSEHHPFTAPVKADEPFLESDPGRVQGRHYDVVCNGYEIGGGSIRIHRADMQRTVFRLLGHSDAAIDDRFGHMLEAFDYGAPPHGGIALGIDRIVMIMAGEDSIREVIAFPKNQVAQDLTFAAPASVSAEQLDDLHISITEEETDD